MFLLTDTANDIEAKLQNSFSSITWIGELSLDPRDFRIIRDSVQISSPRNTLPRLLLTAMVFCARYAEFTDDENINFWGKFFSDVIKKARTQNLENDYREAFKSARTLVQAAHGFEFPTRDTTKTEVVSGVYLHTILPSYLQDDFAKFFLKQYPNPTAWSTLDMLFPDEIAAENEKTTLSAPISKRLIRFVQDPNTSSTAARLIKTLATAALWHNEGLTGESIASVLSPIEQSVWMQLLPLLPTLDVSKVPTRSPATRVRWAWLIEQNDILELHVKNLKLTGKIPPDRLVWLNHAEGQTVRIGDRVPEYGRRYCEVNAYRTAEGYTVDNAILIDIDEAGLLVAVDEQDCALNMPVSTDAPPTNKPVFFRLQPDGQLAILSETERLSDGEYAVSLPAGVAIHGVDEGSVKRIYPLIVPKALVAHGHTVAALYSVKLPIFVGDQRINKRRGHVPPTLNGANLVSGLVPGALPIYEAGDLWFDFSPPSGVPLERLFIRLTANDAAKNHSLSDLDAAGQVTQVSNDGAETFRVRLNNYLPSVCLVQAELFSGLSRMHGDPRLAGLLPPGMRIVASPSDHYYTLSAPPSVRLEGIQVDQIELASAARLNDIQDCIMLTWIDPRQDAALRLKIGTTVLPLTFDVKWSFAWVSPLNGGFLWEDALDEAVLSVRGEPRASFYISVAGGKPRDYMLNARGLMDVAIKQDALKDVLQKYEGERALVHAWFASSGEKIDLFTLIRPQFSDFERQPEVVKDAIRAFKQYLRHGRREMTVAHAYLLPALPIEYSESLPVDALPPVLAALRPIRLGSHPEVRSAFLPARPQFLSLSDSVSYALQKDSSGTYIKLERQSSKGALEVLIRVDMTANGIMLRGANEYLYQCMRCGDLYWSDETHSKLKHGHGKFGVEGRNLNDETIAGHVTYAPPDLDTLRTFTPHFSPFIERDIQSRFRIREQAAARRVKEQPQSLILTKPAYLQATASWTVRLNNAPHQVEPHLKSLYKAHKWSQGFYSELTRYETQPSLIVAVNWLRHEMELRTSHDWTMLDPVVMTVAVAARAYAHGISHLKDPHLIDLLEHAYVSCPELLIWALTWAELIFTHWNDEDAL